MDTINLDELDWTIPEEFERSHETYIKQVATVGDMTLTLRFDIGFQEATLLMENSHGTWWGNTSMDKAHPQLDEAFGRLHWRQFLQRWEDEQHEKMNAEIHEVFESAAWQMQLDQEEERTNRQFNTYRWE